MHAEKGPRSNQSPSCARSRSATTSSVVHPLPNPPSSTRALTRRVTTAPSVCFVVEENDPGGPVVPDTRVTSREAILAFDTFCTQQKWVSPII